MQTESADTPKTNPPLMTFNDHQLIVIEFEDRPWLIAKQVGAKLGYAEDGGSLITLIGRDWGEEFIDGVDCLKLTNGKLAAFKAAIRNYPTNNRVVDARAPSLLLLSESGAQLAAMKREGPEGVAFRKLLRFTILPEWQKARQKPALPVTPPATPPAVTSPAKPDVKPDTKPDTKPEEERRQAELRHLQHLLGGWPLDALRTVEGYLQVWASGTQFNTAMRRLLGMVATMTPEEVSEISAFLAVARMEPPTGGALSKGTRLGLVLGMARRALLYPDAKLLYTVSEAEKQWTLNAPFLPSPKR